MSNQSGVQAAVRDSTGTTGSYTEDWHALFDDAGVAAGTFGERLLSWINDQLGTSYANLPGAMQAFAVEQGFDGWDDMSSVTLGGASTLLSGETDGLAFDFTDQSARVKDTGTPANEYNSVGLVSSGSLVGPAGLLTYSAPSVKLCRQQSGNYAYAAHNLATYSENLALWTNANTTDSGQTLTANASVVAGTVNIVNQATQAHYAGEVLYGAIDVKAGTYTTCYVIVSNAQNDNYATLIVDLSTGTITQTGVGSSATLLDSGIEDVGDGWYRVYAAVRMATTGTVFRVSAGFCAALTGNTFNPSGTISYTTTGTETILLNRCQLTRYPCEDTSYIYVAATSTKFQLPYEYDTSGNCLGVLVEEARTNLCLYSNDLTQSNWVKTSANAAKTATGPDGVASSASTLTATANNGVALQNITSASAARTGSVFLKRRTGTGSVTIAIGETTGSELVSNGTFDSDITGWTLHNSATLAHTGSAIQSTKGAANQGGGYCTVTTVAGKIYKVAGECVSVTAGSGGTVAPRLRVSAVSGGAADLGSVTLSAGSGVFSGSFLATTTTTYIAFADIGSNPDGVSVWDNFSVLEVSETTCDLSSGEWERFAIENKTITNPCVAIKLATSGDAIDVDLVQMEVGAFPTSPIITGSASVTRAGDILELADTAFPFDTAAGTYYAWAVVGDVFNGLYGRLVALNGTGNEALSFQGSATEWFSAWNNTDNLSNINGATSMLNTEPKVAFAYTSAPTRALVVNGSAAATDAHPRITTAAQNKHRFGANATGTYASINSHLKQVMYLPRAMTEAEMQELTS